MTTNIYAILHHEDGHTIQTKWVGDQQGLRCFAQGQGGVEILYQYPGGSISQRQQRNERGAMVHTVTIAGVNEPLPFFLEYWGGCHCGHRLKSFRAPAWETV